MKRICTALLALMLLLGGAVAEEDIFAVNISPTPTVEATPGVPSLRLGISEYTYAVWENTTLGVRFAYPSHWEQTPGRRSICYEEPVGEGEVPARMVVSVKQLDDRADEDEMTSQLSQLVYAIFSQFDSYEIGNLITDVPFMGKTAYSPSTAATRATTSFRARSSWPMSARRSTPSTSPAPPTITTIWRR